MSQSMFLEVIEAFKARSSNRGKALIIDIETDFCLLMCHYISKKGFDCYYAQSLDDALNAVEAKRPDIILADKHFHDDLEPKLHEVIDASDDYDPDVFLYDATAKR